MDIYRLWILEGRLERALHEVRTGKRSVLLRVALSRSSGTTEFLIGGVRFARDITFILWIVRDPEELMPAVIAQRIVHSSGSIVGGMWAREAHREISGWVLTDLGRRVVPLHRITVLGDGLRNVAPMWSSSAALPTRLDARGTVRTRLQALSVAIIGSGRLGGVMATHLARMIGPVGTLLLVDPDILHPDGSSTGTEASQSKRSERLSKVSALAEHLDSLPESPVVVTIPQRASDWTARSLIKRCDLIVCTANNPPARFVCGFLAALFLRPLLLLETREDFEEEQRSGVADIRLILPAGPGAHCLLCADGTGTSLLRTAMLSRLYPTGLRYRHHRADSSLSLKREVAIQAARSVAGFMEGEIGQSVHLRLNGAGEYNSGWFPLPTESGNIRLCPLCRRLGAGDDALEELNTALEEGGEMEIPPLYNPYAGGL